MPRTRAQAQAQEVESPLVSLEDPRRRRRIPTTTPSKASADTKKATNMKTKRGRKPTKKATAVATEEITQENTQNKSEIATPEIQPIQPLTQEFQWTQETPQNQGKVPTLQTPRSINTAQDNGSITSPAPATPQFASDSDASSISSLGSVSSLGSPAKKASVRNALKFFKKSIKQSSATFRRRFHELKSRRQPRENLFETGVPALPTDVDSYPTYQTNYSLAEDEILEAALKIVLRRQTTDGTKPFAESIRCPCCYDGVVKMECVRGHDLRSLMSNETIQALNMVLTNICAEGILATAKAKEDRLRVEKEAEAKAKDKATKLAEQQKKEISAKQKGKKRALESNNDENTTDGPPRAQRRRTRPPPGQTPRNKRRPIPTTNPGKKLSFMETARQRAMSGERASAQSSIFQLDEAVTNLRELEQAQQAAKEAAEEEARNVITQKAMERHMVLGPIPENMQSSFQVPVYEDEFNVEDNEDENQPVETPTSKNWGLRSFLGSVRRRLVPFVRQTPDQAVPFAAGGGVSTVRVDGAAASTTETNSIQNADVDMTYSLFPLIPSPPGIAHLSEGKAKAGEQEDKGGKNTATVEEKVQVPGTEQTDQDKTNGEPQNRESQNADTQADPETGSHKRKRAPSPDVIPNPAGCSYGMDLDYFTYSDDEIEEAEEHSRRELEREAAASANSTVSAPTARPPEKRARFLPPEPEPLNVQLPTTNTTTQTHWQAPIPAGWNRPTTTVYSGQMFQGMRHAAPSFHLNPYHPTPDLRSQPPPLENPFMQPMQPVYPMQPMQGMEPMQPSPKTFPQSGSISDLHKAAVERRLWNNLVNNGLGTQTNRSPHPNVSQPAQQPVAHLSPVRTPAQQPIMQTRVEPATQQTVQQPRQQPSVPTPAAQPTQQVFQQTATGASSNGVATNQPRDRSLSAATKQNVSDETIHLPPIKPISATARGQPVIERSRPKTPSRLRNHIPLSSSPASQASPAQTLTAMHQQDRDQDQDQEDLIQIFGDDEHGKQAFELYQSCPSGDLSKVQWPSFDPLPPNNIQETTRLTPVGAGLQRASQNLFQKSFEQFQNELDQGLIDAGEILSDL